jgi:hypothetical protein
MLRHQIFYIVHLSQQVLHFFLVSLNPFLILILITINDNKDDGNNDINDDT